MNGVQIGTHDIAARCDRPDQDPLTNFITCDAGAKFLNYAHRFVANDKAGLHWIFTPNDVEIRATDCCQRYPDDSLADTGMRALDLFYAYIIDTVEHVGSHFSHG